MIEQTLLDGRVELYSCCIFQLSILNNKYHKFINSQRNEFKHTKLIFTFQLYSNYHDLTILLCQKFLHSFFQFSHKLYMEKYYIFLFFSFFLLTYQLSLFLHVPLTLVSSPPLYFLLPHPASLHPYPSDSNIRATSEPVERPFSSACVVPSLSWPTPPSRCTLDSRTHTPALACSYIFAVDATILFIGRVNMRVITFNSLYLSGLREPFPLCLQTHSLVFIIFACFCLIIRCLIERVHKTTSVCLPYLHVTQCRDRKDNVC